MQSHDMVERELEPEDKYKTMSIARAERTAGCYSLRRTVKHPALQNGFSNTSSLGQASNKVWSDVTIASLENYL